MKFRTGFVSNSSTSSYICDLCGEHMEGMDLSLSEAGMVQCINGHTMCENEVDLSDIPEDHPFDYDDDLEYGGEWDDNDGTWHEPYRYELPEKFCPICCMELFSTADIAAYLLNVSGISRATVFAVVKEKNKRRKKLYDQEYVDYCLDKLSLSATELHNTIRGRFNSYKEFYDFNHTMTLSLK